MDRLGRVVQIDDAVARLGRVVQIDDAGSYRPPGPALGSQALVRVRDAYRGLSKSQRRVADRLLSTPGEFAFRSASSVAQELGSSASTVVRFAVALGYSGYPDLQRALQADLLTERTTVDRLQLTTTQLRGVGAPGLIRDVIGRDVNYLLATDAGLARGEFEACVQILNNARRVYLVGMWSSHAPAYLLSVGLGFLGIDARLLGSARSNLADELHGACDEDVLVAVSVGRSPTLTASALELAAEIGLARIAITDQAASSIAVRSNRVLIAHSGPDRLFKSVTSAISVVNLLVTACAIAEPTRAERTLEEFESLWERTAAFVPDHN
jgi:DNA-binding MurR/RpiR family transcriptional regulator